MCVSMWCTWAVLMVAACAGARSADEWREVQIAQGSVRGHMDPAGGVYAFYNIPYASVPTGTDRFKGPLPPPVWMHHTFDAVDRGIVCPQIPMYPQLMMQNSFMQEDCLVANVFVPDTHQTNLPVLINIHGGGYQFGAGNEYTFLHFVRSNGVIVVTFNYRLAAHGFLCLGTEDAPGNAGIKDQIALLRWVKENIASFGGNPEDVTLQGCSAGGGSVDLLTISGAADGLFNKAIVESGVTFGTAGVIPDPIENAKMYARLLNFTDVDDINALAEFYTTASYELLNSKMNVIMLEHINTKLLFAPCVEKDLGQERALGDAPINIIKSGLYTKVPLLYGFALMEGSMILHQFEIWRHLMNDKFSNFLMADLKFASDDEKEEVAKTIKEFYFGDQPISEHNILAFIDYFTDIMFGSPMLRALTHRVDSLNDTIYLYEYTFADEFTPNVPYTDVPQVNHCAQTIAVFDEDERNMTADYRQMKATMREIWFNFISTGIPVGAGSQLPLWPPASAARTPHMSLGRAVELRGGLLDRRASFWDAIYEQHYRTPAPPAAGDDSSTDGSLIITYIFYYFIFVILLLLVVSVVFFDII